MQYAVALNTRVENTPFNSPMLPDVRPQRGTGKGSQYSKAEQKRIIEHGLVHRLIASELAEHFNVSQQSIYNWRRDYMVGMYADEIIYNHTVAFRRS